MRTRLTGPMSSPWIRPNSVFTCRKEEKGNVGMVVSGVIGTIIITGVTGAVIYYNQRQPILVPSSKVAQGDHLSLPKNTFTTPIASPPKVAAPASAAHAASEPGTPPLHPSRRRFGFGRGWRCARELRKIVTHTPETPIGLM